MRADIRMAQRANQVLSEKLRFAQQDNKDLHNALQRSDTEMRAYKAGIARLEERIEELEREVLELQKHGPTDED